MRSSHVVAEICQQLDYFLAAITTLLQMGVRLLHALDAFNHALMACTNAGGLCA
eukprot:m.763916 g.763916  ORF g.763916 m.763916 type:complete len:54 (-) comp23212_c0_seq2:2187-2348(-)